MFNRLFRADRGSLQAEHEDLQLRIKLVDAVTETAKAHNLANRIPLRREGSVDDVASAALELIRNDFMTGEIVTVDGGMSMRITG